MGALEKLMGSLSFFLGFDDGDGAAAVRQVFAQEALDIRFFDARVRLGEPERIEAAEVAVRHGDGDIFKRVERAQRRAEARAADLLEKVRVDALAREGIDPDFFEQIRRASFGATLRALNSFENIAISMADGYFRGFDALRFPEAYASIEKADVERFLRENLTDSRRAISIIEPKKEG